MGPGGRVRGEEVAEGVLVTAQRQYEERKIQFLGYMLANLAFESQVNAYLANWTTRVVSELSWAQLVMLAAIEQKQPFLPDVVIGQNMGTWNSWGLHEQLADLGWSRRELILASSETIERRLDINLRLRDQRLNAGGRLLYELLWLKRVPDEDINDVLGRLST